MRDEPTRNYEIEIETNDKEVYDEIMRILQLAGVKKKENTYLYVSRNEEVNYEGNFDVVPSSEEHKESDWFDDASFDGEQTNPTIREMEMTYRFDHDKSKKKLKPYNISFSNMNQNGRATIKNRISYSGNNTYFDVMRERWANYSRKR